MKRRRSLGKVDLRLLRAFLAVAEDRHFGRAGRRLGISTSALSQRINRLESLAGTPLFDRAPVALTSAGEAMLPAAERAVQAAVVADETLQSLTSARQPRLRVGVLSHGAGALTAAAIREFTRSEPSVRVTVHGIDFPDTVAAVLDARIDVAFVRPRLGDSRLTEFSVGVEPRYAILPRWDERTHLPALKLLELDRDTFLTPADDTPSPYRRFLHLLDERNDDEPRLAETRCRRAEEFLTAVASGQGIATTIRSFTNYYRWPEIAYVPISDANPAATTLVTAADDHRSLVERFRARTIQLASSARSSEALS